MTSHSPPIPGSDVELLGERHRYNNDLLLDATDRKCAREDFPRITDALDRPRLREAFEQADRSALRAKRRSQAVGFWALISGLLALMIASSSPLFHSGQGAQGHAPQLVVGALGVLLAVAAVLIGWFGLLRGEHKKSWLHTRLYTERLRQFHFQAMMMEVATPQDGDLPADRERRWTGWFERFQLKHGPDLIGDRMSKVLDPNEPPQVWLIGDGFPAQPRPKRSPLRTELFHAYKTLRLEHQQNYAMHMLRVQNAPGAASLGVLRRLAFPFAGWPLRAQTALLHNVWVVSFVTMVLLHIAVFQLSFTDKPPGEDSWVSAGLHVLVVWCGLVAIASKTLGEALGLKREIDRYEEYRASVADLVHRFDPTGEPAECIEIMIEMERLSYEEMRAFLRTHNESSFIL